MKLVYEILQKLRSQEIRQLKDRFKHGSFEHEKVGTLFDLVTQYDQRDESFYSQELYGKEPDNTFRVTKSRLKRMMENVLLSDKSLTTYRSKAIVTRLQLRKKLLQAEILLGRGAYQAGKNLLQNIISTAKKSDLLEEAYQAERLLYRNLNIRMGVKDYQKLTERLLSSNQLLMTIEEARILYYSVANLLQNQTLKEEEKENVRQTIDRLADLAGQTRHPQVQHLYYLSEVYYQQIDEADEQALDFCLQYLELIQQNEHLYTPQREAVAYGQLAQVHLRLLRLEEAASYAGKILKMFSKVEINYLRSLELCFVISFFDENWPLATEYLQEALSHPEFETAPHLAARWHYYEACLLFRQKKYQPAYLKLNDTTALLADKQGMNLYIRILEIMLLFELGHMDLLETKIVNLNQFVKRAQLQKQIRPKSLMSILGQWHRHHFDFTRIDLNKDSVDPDLQKGTTEELIKLEDWMAGHGAS